ncbi:nitrilase-related carbon-nitrogen hydrolase [Nocardia camponoti]|uniref:Nitrilase n=1 Tax=Nocardia camponoti TaxID=1616106 RepID=A0A917QLG8_9NOCA|nr:nitrilase-related carbon-nitrogen hydrolase [Nocardia camponoti]GGK57319.1 nitrilase [Nocardia camponoti]
MKQVRVAAVQAEPKWLNKAAGIEQVTEFVYAAADADCQLVAFPETFLPGFPWWMWLRSVEWGDEFQARYLANSLSAEGPELRAVSYAARRRGIAVSLGFAERVGRQVFMSQALVESTGTITIARKASPVGLEQSVFAKCTSTPLIKATEHGRIGVLGGSDHADAERVAHLRAAREQIHVAAWSGFTVAQGDEPDPTRDVACATSVRYALDHATFVIAPVAVVPVSGWEVADSSGPDRRLLHGGGGVSRVFGPSGQELATPLPEGEEGLVVADLTLLSSIAGTRRGAALTPA